MRPITYTALATLLILALTGCQTTPQAAQPTTAALPTLTAPASFELPAAYRVEDVSRTDLRREVTVDCQACEPCRLGCWDPSPCRNRYLDVTGSFLPNVGIGGGGGFIFKRTPKADYALELHATWQFLDDETFADDGNPEADDWYQIRAGMKIISTPKARRHLTGRVGAVWIQANGAPNILDRPGDYYGIYGAIGFETDLTPQISVGPELALMLVTGDDEFKVETPVPQLNWHFIYWMGARGDRCLTRVPYGEIYVGAAASLSPGVGGGVEFGQVFARSSLATWSLELMAGGQDTTQDLFFDQDGEYAQIRGGVKAAFQPCSCCGHFTARAGATWLRSTATNDFLTQTGDYVGVYVGAGYEWDIGNRFTTGPELALNAVAREGSSDIDFLPQLHWHFILKL